MTEVEFSRLLSELTQTAAALNKASDGINTIIERCEQKLKELNVGLECWVTINDLVFEYDEATGQEDEDGNPLQERRRSEWQLGYGRDDDEDEWLLMVRQVEYRPDGDRPSEWKYAQELARTRHLLKTPRRLRICALKVFPNLLKAINQEALGALKAIENARGFVQ
jgi:hypothetical protein